MATKPRVHGMEEQFEKRLDRFEQKLDRLAEAMSSIVRVEERQAQHTDTLARAWNELERLTLRQGKMEDRMLDIETIRSSAKGRLDMWERVGWVVLSATIYYIFRGN